MKKIILILILTLSIISLASADLYYKFSFDYNGVDFSNPDASLFDFNFTEASTIRIRDSGMFFIKIISFDQEVLFKNYFDISLMPFGAAPEYIFDDENNQISEPELIPFDEEVRFVITAPYFNNAQNYEIYDTEKRILLLSYELAHFSKDISEKRYLARYFVLLMMLVVLLLSLYIYINKTNVK